MKFILIDPGISIGGIEVLMGDFAKYLVRKKVEVLFVISEGSKSIYYELIGTDYNIKFCEVLGLNNTIFYSKKSKVYNSDRKKIFNYIEDKEQVYVVTCFFYTLQYAMNIFELYSDYTKILQIWSHPLEWVHRLVHNNNYVYKKRKNSLYYYQQKLLQEITNTKASHFISKSIFDFNNWYYEANLSQPVGEKMWCAPVRFNQSNKSIKKVKHEIEDKFRVLWIGRLTYFKSDAVIYIFKTLEELSRKHSMIKFIFNVIGDGSKADWEYVNKHIVPEKIEVHYWGTIAPDKLYEYIENNDIGISMGLSVKIMAANGLPSILIDSLDSKYKCEKNCNWIFETDDGDAGDGLYYHIMGYPLEYRMCLFNMLESVLNKTIDLDVYSTKCKEYVENKYSFEKKYNDLYDEAINSQLKPNACKTFHYNIFVRAAFQIYNVLKRVINNA